MLIFKHRLFGINGVSWKFVLVQVVGVKIFLVIFL